MKNSNKEFGDIEKILERKFASSGLDGYVSIAFGEAVTKLYEREINLGAELPSSARKAFLFTTGKNKILNELRRLGKLLPIDDESKGIDNFPELTVNSFERNEITKLYVEELLQKLSPKSREVLVMHYEEELTVKQIAEKLELSVDGVKKRLKEAMKELRK